MIVLILIFEAVVIALTALGCRLKHKWHHRAGWHIGIIGAILAATIFSLPSDWHLLTHLESWSWKRSHDKESLSSVLFGFLWLTGMAVPVALFVVYLYRKNTESRAMRPNLH